MGVPARYGYDIAGRRTSLTRGNGTVTNYGYQASRLASLTQDLDAPLSSANDLTLGVEYNRVGQIVRNERSNNLYSWTGTPAGTTNSTANGLNQMAVTGGPTLTYDARGNLTYDGLTSFTYTSENLLTGTSRPGGFNFTLGYDPLMRLSSTSGYGGFQYLYDGDRLVQTIGAVYGTGRWVHGPGTDEILVNVSAASGARTYYHADERGSIVATSDDAGTTVATRSYDEYGRPSGAGLGFGFTGQMFLPEAGPTTAYYYRARVYHSGLGRFLQADPIGYGDGMNMYAYVGGDPVNRSDPSGTATICVAPLGSRIRSMCVGVDGDGDGNTGDNDMNPRLINAFAADFGGFILANGSVNGRRIDHYGKTVLGDANANQKTAVSVASQFVGAAIDIYGYTGLDRQWGSIPVIVASRRGYGDRSVGAANVCLLASGCEITGPVSIYTGPRIGFSGSGGDSYLPSLYGSPSNIARGILHEVGHGLYPNPISPEAHQSLDTYARGALMRMGLGGGGCVALNGFPGC